ncbi:MAG TPA: DUF1835 domain-containing protein [Candidatus Egerieimonas intestinavium]|uniref:DUF1835 domain-containing protein n=1 Tax=Candidatus Egerieimonas intestinavium TaxID=2840777 RepID=A0A9D1JHJ8_9FIRM|nr:DUF1835 domain-containing protein [Candidatus Egerieimonas intestinavium]
MIEVLFGESEAASMKAAKSTVVLSRTDGPTALWMAGKKKPPKRERGPWIPGTAHEVICLGFMLDIGDIQEKPDSQYRRNLIYSLYAQGQWGRDEEEEKELRKAGEIYGGELQRLQNYLDSGEAIRIWYSDAPYSLCGFYFLCSMLKNVENDIRAVKLPPYASRGNAIVWYQNWGEIAAEEFSLFLPQERALSREELRMYAMLWSGLQEENSPLRAVVNGRLLGVPEDFYDFLLWGSLSQKPVKEARLIGEILGKTQISVGDLWYAKRIDYFIGQGKIKVLEESENKYQRVISLA